MLGFFKLEPWKDKIALIMGVNSPLGVAVAEKLLKLDMKVVGVDEDACHLENLQKNRDFRFIKANLSNEDDIIEVIFNVEDMGGAELLINIIEVFMGSSLLDANSKEWRELINRYILSLNMTTREIKRSMMDHRIELGHFVNILNFSAGKIPKKSHLQFYRALKRIVEGITSYVRKEVDEDGLIRITSISSVFEDPLKEEQRNSLQPHHFADAVEYAISAPIGLEVTDLVLETMKS